MTFWEEEADLAAEFVVRHPTPDDRTALTDLYLRAWHHTYGSWGLGWSRDKVVEELYFERQESSRWLLAFHQDRMVGLLRASPCLRRIEKMFVDPRYLRTGAGYSLMRAYLWRVAKRYDEATVLSLELFTDLERACAFFRSFGYEESEAEWTSATTKRTLRTMTMRFTPVEPLELRGYFGR